MPNSHLCMTSYTSLNSAILKTVNVKLYFKNRGAKLQLWSPLGRAQFSYWKTKNNWPKAIKLGFLVHPTTLRDNSNGQTRLLAFIIVSFCQ